VRQLPGKKENEITGNLSGLAIASTLVEFAGAGANNVMESKDGPYVAVNNSGEYQDFDPITASSTSLRPNGYRRGCGRIGGRKRFLHDQRR
jgi:hypothetical protein